MYVGVITFSSTVFLISCNFSTVTCDETFFVASLATPYKKSTIEGNKIFADYGLINKRASESSISRLSYKNEVLHRVQKGLLELEVLQFHSRVVVINAISSYL